MFEYLLFHEDGSIKLTDKEEKWDSLYWRSVVRVSTGLGDYGIEYARLNHDNEWVDIEEE